MNLAGDRRKLEKDEDVGLYEEKSYAGGSCE